MMKRFLLVAIALISFGVHAKVFTSQFTEFLLPNGWECAMEGSEWVCQSTNNNRKKEAIIILAAKLKGGQDSLSHYQTYLKNTKEFKIPGGKKQVSEPKYTNIKDIKGHKWVDSLHLASEVPGFYTRYLATVKGDLGVLVTFSVSKDHYSSYSKVIDGIVESLKVFAQMKNSPTKFVRQARDGSLPGEGEFVEDGSDALDIGLGARKRQKSGSSDGSTDMIMYIIGAAAVAFVLMRMKKGKKKTKKKKKKSKK